MTLDRILPLVIPLLKPMLRPGQRRRQARFDTSAPLPGRVVFLGDSITEGGFWDELFPEIETLNRGIGGYAVCDVAANLESSLIAPRAISLLIGTNDLHGLGLSRRLPEIAAQVDALVVRIRETAPDAVLLLNGVLPRTPHFRDRIQDLNDRYADIAGRSGSTYVDAWPALATPQGAIRPEFTLDGVHLSTEGYRAWATVLRPHLARFCQR